MGMDVNVRCSEYFSITVEQDQVHIHYEKLQPADGREGKAENAISKVCSLVAGHELSKIIFRARSDGESCNYRVIDPYGICLANGIMEIHLIVLLFHRELAN